MFNKLMIRDSFIIFPQCIHVFWIYILYQMSLGLIIGLMAQLVTYSVSNVLSIPSYILFTSIISIALIIISPFFDAGFYSILFLKMNFQNYGLKDFIYLASKNYVWFLIIGLIFGFINGVVFNQLNIIILGKIPVVISNKFHYVTLPGYLTSFESFLTSVLFVFSYPLVVLGFFSKSNLNPIKSSLTLVIKYLKNISFIIFLLFIYAFLNRFLDAFFSDDYFIYRKTFMPIITTPFMFLIFIYSYLFLTKKVYNDLNFDFKT